MKKNKLLKLLGALSPEKPVVDFSEFDNEVELVKKKFERRLKLSVGTIDDMSLQFEKIKKNFDISPLVTAVTKLKGDFENKIGSIQHEIDQKILELARAENAQMNGLQHEIILLQDSLASFSSSYAKDIDLISSEISKALAIEGKINLLIEGTVDGLHDDMTHGLSLLSIEVQENFTEELAKLKRELLATISGLGGGNMNRQIFINSVDPLTKYTDINLKAGSNVLITYTNNNTTKKVDVTISATGGPGGTTRVISSVSVPTIAGDSAGTDYVYLVSGTTTITLPTAVANTNLYTIKNVGVGTVTVNTTGGETIDGGLTASLPVQYTSVDLISDTSNWNVT